MNIVAASEIYLSWNNLVWTNFCWSLIEHELAMVTLFWQEGLIYPKIIILNFSFLLINMKNLVHDPICLSTLLQTQSCHLHFMSFWPCWACQCLAYVKREADVIEYQFSVSYLLIVAAPGILILWSFDSPFLSLAFN